MIHLPASTLFVVIDYEVEPCLPQGGPELQFHSSSQLDRIALPNRWVGCFWPAPTQYALHQFLLRRISPFHPSLYSTPPVLQRPTVPYTGCISRVCASGLNIAAFQVTANHFGQFISETAPQRQAGVPLPCPLGELGGREESGLSSIITKGPI